MARRPTPLRALARPQVLSLLLLVALALAPRIGAAAAIATSAPSTSAPTVHLHQKKNAALQALISALPKAELHLHLEGTLEVDLMMRLAAKNNITLPYTDAAQARASRRDYASLEPFLAEFRVAMRTLRRRTDFQELAAAYLKRAAENNVRRAEIFVDLQTHVRNGVAQDDVIAGIMAAIRAASSPDHAPQPIEAALILCFVRDFGPRAAFTTALRASRFYQSFIGVGLASAEKGFPPAPFAPTYKLAKMAGLHRVAHAGEEGGPEYVWQALDDLGVERVDHGVRAIEDPKLVAALRERRIPLTVCPLSNRALKVYDGQLQQRMRQLFLESGDDLLLTINSDDPAYFAPPPPTATTQKTMATATATTTMTGEEKDGQEKRNSEGESEEAAEREQEAEEQYGYLNANYRFIAELVGLTPEQLLRLAQRSLNASFWPEEKKRAVVEEAEGAYQAWVRGVQGEAYREAVAALEHQETVAVAALEYQETEAVAAS